jgi:CDP-glucose 4,6-dehydratase
MFHDTYRGLKVLLTGHTGFKGAWLTTWLVQLGAEVVGYSLEPPTSPNLFELNSLRNKIQHYHEDVRDRKRLREVFDAESPDFVIHFAAQSLVLTSYQNPVETFEVNVQGTVNVMDAAINCEATRGILLITTDKVYENHEWVWGYRENDRLGGHDPYSASKAMAELAIASYRQSFSEFQGKRCCIASARAGNVIGGGDFSDNRLLPDSMKALMSHQPIEIRNPSSIRPWMHVLDPLSGYLWLGHKMLTEGEKFAEAWNFAPKDRLGVNCQTVVEKAIECWGAGDWVDASEANALAEMKSLQLNGDKATNDLGWVATYNWSQAVAATVEWYKAYGSTDMYSFTVQQIEEYSEQAKKSFQY